MIRFIDLNTGNTFNGQQPYIFWFDGQQSTNIWYSQPICFISTNETEIISLPDNEVFKLLDPNKLDTFKNIQYNNLTDLVSKNDTINIYGYKYMNSYIYIIYIIGHTTVAGEYIENFKIGNEVFKIGADFYQEEESLYINLSNMGVDIPENIQKAIYNSNLREDKRDNILLNRKWKELLSNYWDTIACKGSSKSLFNTLKWFEYGDLLKLSELWKTDDNNYIMIDLNNILKNQYKNILETFRKTTFISISCALEKIKYDNDKIIYDEQKNPTLEHIVSKWSIQDLSLKLSLLGSFYETYFLPIHLDLIHCTIEDIVYTNTFKETFSPIFSRKDLIYDNSNDLKCNVKDNEVFHLEHTKCYVGPNTLFGSKYEDGYTFGVQKDQINEPLTDDELRDYVWQLFDDIGTVVDFHIHLPSLNKIEGDKIKREILYINDYQITDYQILDENINFSLLFKRAGKYNIRLQFDSIQGRTYTKSINVIIKDYYEASLKIYKVYSKSLDEINASTIINSNILNDKFSIFNDSSSSVMKQYLPLSCDNGICRNHLLICKITDEISANLPNIEKNYFIYTKNNTYYVFISKNFEQNCDGIRYVSKEDIIRDDYIFIPEYHDSVLMQGEKLDDYTINKNEIVYVKPDIKTGKKIADNEYEWVFINESLPNNDPDKEIFISQKNSIRSPLITYNTGKILKPGYYSIELKYSFTDGETKTIKLNSAFRVK